MEAYFMKLRNTNTYLDSLYSYDEHEDFIIILKL